MILNQLPHQIPIRTKALSQLTICVNPFPYDDPVDEPVLEPPIAWAEIASRSHSLAMFLVQL